MGQYKDALFQAALGNSEERIWNLEQKLFTAQSDLVRCLRTSHAYKMMAEELQEHVSEVEALLEDQASTVRKVQAELKSARNTTGSSWQLEGVHGDAFSRQRQQCGQVGSGNLVDTLPASLRTFHSRFLVSLLVWE
jgi:predicted phage tail protein